MAEAKHYCAECDTHFRVDPQEHADLEHDGYLFHGIENGDFRDYKRKHDA
jgi:hypothetical protein